MKDSTSRVGAFLRLRGPDGATVAEIRSATTFDRGSARVHELIHEHRWRIDKVMERTDAGALVARYFYRSEPASRPQPLRGTQEALALA